MLEGLVLSLLGYAYFSPLKCIGLNFIYINIYDMMHNVANIRVCNVYVANY